MGAEFGGDGVVDRMCDEVCMQHETLTGDHAGHATLSLSCQLHLYAMIPNAAFEN